MPKKRVTAFLSFTRRVRRSFTSAWRPVGNSSDGVPIIRQVQISGFPRVIERIKDIPLTQLPTKKVYDRGTYSSTKSANKDETEKKLLEGIKANSFSFILNGSILKGRFALKHRQGNTTIQKYKDKYAVEEDVLTGDLSRTIDTMMPDYDPSKIKLHHPKPKEQKRIQEAPKENIEEEITPDMNIGNTRYHFAFYTSTGEPDICIVTDTNNKVLVLKKKRNQWVLLSPQNLTSAKVTQLTAHCEALFKVASKTR